MLRSARAGGSRLNPPSEWMTREVPALRIVSDELWTAAKARQERTRHELKSAGHLRRARRPQYLFSGLTKCGVCGAGFIMAGRNRLACFGARDQGRCDNLLTIRREEVEARVLKAPRPTQHQRGAWTDTRLTALCHSTA
jgi:site-specific DNA recombinase